MVRPKKYLGQHFLKDQNIARKIVDAFSVDSRSTLVLEIGPGTGVLTEHLLKNKALDLRLIEIDKESVDHLEKKYALGEKVIHGDFLEMNLKDLTEKKVAIIGNFPYNISSQIFFKILEQRDQVVDVVCMLQKEVADRISSPHGNKTYGILSVLLQAYYNITFLFKVPPGVFFPPPKVMSAVIQLKRNATERLDCNERLFQRVVKQGFQNRRKTLRNALKPLNLPAAIVSMPVLDKRAEQLSVEDFVRLTATIERSDERSS
jgi:16S rRNA (adenine1518-N6/adenine1519-N6)-dimethyltransferase